MPLRPNQSPMIDAAAMEETEGSSRRRQKQRKRWGLIKKLRKEAAMKWKIIGAFRWKRMTSGVRLFSFFDGVVFRILSVLEAVVLVTALCFFYLCCGCNF